MKRLGALGSLLCLLVACGDDEEPREDAAVRTDAAVDAAVLTDARASDARASEDARAPSDAEAPVDAAADATVPDAGVPTSLRAAICGSIASWPNPLPAMNMRSARLVEDGFSFVEGPVWVRTLGVLLFSDMNFDGSNALGPPAQIRRLASGNFDVLQPSSGSNGLALFAPTTLLAATHDTRSLSFFDASSGARKDIAITYQNKKFNSPNDIAIRDDGWVYFSDPDYQLGSRNSELKTAVYRVQLGADTTTASALLVDDSLTQPNGVTLSPDQKTLYVSSSGPDVFKWDVAADGSVSTKTSFAKPGAGDGLAVDCAGNLYVTSGGVQVFAPNGDKLGTINVGKGTSNVAFGGIDSRTLYITARDSLYAIDLNVPGFPY